MVFLWGVLEDSPTFFIYNALIKLNHDVFFLDHKEIASTTIVFDSQNQTYTLIHKDVSWNLDNFRSAYLRPYDISKYAGFEEPINKELYARASIFHQIMVNWAENTTIPVINRPSAASTNNSKLFQSIVIRDCGLLIPPSLVSNNKININAFLSQHGRVIYKSLSGIRSKVEEYFPTHLEGKTSLGLMFFQKYIEGNNIRVHVVGKRLFATIITTSGVDYRYAPSDLEPYTLPKRIAESCILCNKKLGLLLSGIDLIKTANDEWYCLEVNTNPGFSYFDREEGNSIATAIAEFLSAPYI